MRGSIEGFLDWHTLKASIAHRDVQGIPTINEREIYWCTIGMNIGSEEYGKGVYYNRPVLVVTKFNNYLFWGIPLTSTLKTGKQYFPIILNEKKQTLMLSQMRIFDARRIFSHRDCIWKISRKELALVKITLKELL